VLVLRTDTLDLGPVPLDIRGEGSFPISNSGTQSLDVQLSLQNEYGPFDLSQDTISLGPGEQANVTVWFEARATLLPQEALLTLAPTDGSDLVLTILAVTDPDGDADGHDHMDLGGDDCDDTDPAVYPSAEEIWYDDIDQDCDQASDHDADRDGWDVMPVGQDCDDQDSAVSPSATEVWYDGVDQNCDEDSDYDSDQDGFDREPEGTDCDDADRLVHPGAAEVWYDGVDQDCDQGSDYDADGDGIDSELGSGDDCDDTDANTNPDATEEDDLEDDDCDGLVDEDYLLAGDLLISEVMVDPAAVYDHYGQFVELTNVSSREVDLSGWAFESAGGNVRLLGGYVLMPGGRVLLCSSSDLLLNGGLVCDEAWDGFTLASPDRTELSAGSLVIDDVSWTPLWSFVEGASLSLDPDSFDADSNDERLAWCSATSAMTSGDLGTPGTANDPCP
jgi:hypothetical protein